MSYRGYLLKIGNYTFPLNHILTDSIIITKKILDLDSYRDSNGELHREALEHWVANIELTVEPFLSGDEFTEIMDNIKNNYITPGERKAEVTVFIPEINDYVTQKMYIPDIDAQIFDSDSNGNVQYQSFKLEFIGY